MGLELNGFFIVTFLSILKHNFFISFATPKLSCPCFLVTLEAVGNSGLGKIHIFY